MDICTIFKENFMRNIVDFPSEDSLIELSEQPEYADLSEGFLLLHQLIRELYSWCGSSITMSTTSCDNEEDALLAFLAPMKALFSICINGFPTEAADCFYLQVEKTAFTNTLKQLKLSKGETTLPLLGNVGIHYEYRKDRVRIDDYKNCDSLWVTYSLAALKTKNLIKALTFWGTALKRIAKISDGFTAFLRLDFRPCFPIDTSNPELSETMMDIEKALLPSSFEALTMLRSYIANSHDSYQSVDIKLNHLSRGDWSFNYRKQPKVGKALCGVLIKDGRLSLRIVFLSEAAIEVLHSRYSFGEKVRNAMMETCKCKYCRGTGCGLKQVLDLEADGIYEACVYPWSYIDDVLPDDIADIQAILEIQSRYMKQDPKNQKSLPR